MIEFEGQDVGPLLALSHPTAARGQQSEAGDRPQPRNGPQAPHFLLSLLSRRSAQSACHDGAYNPAPSNAHNQEPPIRRTGTPSRAPSRRPLPLGPFAPN